MTGRPRVERKLAAILAADVVGYSRLMGEDEEGTLAALKTVRQEVTDPAIKENRGRIVKTMGDGLLLEFASVVDAVLCAVEIQRKMTGHNREVRPDRRIVFRIGINVGDVIIEEDDIFGEGVNVAARLEALAEPGGICISRIVRDQVRGKLDITFVDQGDRQLKNIARPVRAFRIWLADDPPPEPTPLPPEKPGAVAPPPQPAPVTTRKSDPPYFLLFFQKISKFRAAAATVVLLAGSASVVSLSIDTHLKFRGPSFFRASLQSGESPTERLPPGPVEPNSPPSQPVDNRSVAYLAAPSGLIGEPVFFEKDKVVIPASANSIIDRQAGFLRDNPSVTVTIEGYCSEDEGTREGPEALAQLRANQVRNALKERGIAATRIQTLVPGRLRSANTSANEVPRPQDRRAVVIRD